jgi:hypothetical protein
MNPETLIVRENEVLVLAEPVRELLDAADKNETLEIFEQGPQGPPGPVGPTGDASDYNGDPLAYYILAKA